MIHIWIDDFETNDGRVFACGIPELPEGDLYFFSGDPAADRADCPGCNPDGPRKLGTPLSQLSGRPGHAGFAEFCRIAESWGY